MKRVPHWGIVILFLRNLEGWERRREGQANSSCKFIRGRVIEKKGCRCGFVAWWPIYEIVALSALALYQQAIQAMHCLSRSLQRHARLKVRCAAGSALPRRRFQATEAPKSATNIAATGDASVVAGPSSSSTTSASLNTPSQKNIRLASPQHPEQRSTDLSQHATYPASSTLEQLALLEVCLAVGNITRARKVFSTIQAAYAKEVSYYDSASEFYDDFDPSSGQWRKRLQFSDIVPAAVHAQFLRAYFRQAIVQDSAKLAKGSQLKKRAAVSQAWEWFEMLLAKESTFGRLEDSAWAVMLKGLVA